MAGLANEHTKEANDQQEASFLPQRRTQGRLRADTAVPRLLKSMGASLLSERLMRKKVVTNISCVPRFHSDELK